MIRNPSRRTEKTPYKYDSPLVPCPLTPFISKRKEMSLRTFVRDTSPAPPRLFFLPLCAGPSGQDPLGRLRLSSSAPPILTRSFGSGYIHAPCRTLLGHHAPAAKSPTSLNQPVRHIHRLSRLLRALPCQCDLDWDLCTPVPPSLVTSTVTGVVMRNDPCRPLLTALSTPSPRS